MREPVQPLIHFDDRVVESIWRATGGHPFLTQLICHRLLQGVTGQDQRHDLIDMTRLSGVLDTILNDDDAYLLAVWDNCSAAEQRTLAALAECVPADQHTDVSFARLCEALGATDNGARASLARELGALSSRSLIWRMPLNAAAAEATIADGTQEAPDTGFAFSFDLLRRWVLAQRPLRQLPQPALTKS